MPGIEQTQLDIILQLYVGKHLVLTDGQQIVDNQAHSHAAAGGENCAFEYEFPGNIRVPEIREDIERGNGGVDERQPPRQSIVAAVK